MSRYITEILISVIGLLITLPVPVYFTVRNIQTGNDILKYGLLLFFALVTIGFVFSIRLRTSFQFYLNDKNKLIVIDTEKETLELTENDQQELIPFSNIYLVYSYQCRGYDSQSYYKLIFKEPLKSGMDHLIITDLTTLGVEKYLKNIDYRVKHKFILFLTQNKKKDEV